MKNRSSYAVLTRFGIIAAILATLVLIAPAVSAADPLEFSYEENGEDPVATFSASDPDADAGDIDWDLKGVDAGAFEIDGGVLTFESPPDFESPTDKDEDTAISGDQGAGDNKYQITVLASGGEQDVVVKVTNKNEPGSVTFTQIQAQATRPLMAEYDDDDKPKDPTWQWSLGPSAEGPWTEISGATSADRAPSEDDIGSWLQATVSYTDSFGATSASGAIGPVVDETLSNAAPSFSGLDDDDDTAGVQIEIDFNENAEGNIGDPLTATDADGDPRLYTITGGLDADCFGIAETSGQLSLSGKRNFESPNAACKTGGDARTSAADADRTDDGTNDYVVEITATDPTGATGSATVTVSLQDVNEASEFTGPAKADENVTLYIDENEKTTDADTDGQQLELRQNEADADETADTDDSNTAVVAYTATDPDADTLDTNDQIRYKVEGADAAQFDIGEETGVLGFASADDKLGAKGADYEGKKSYSITIVATSGGIANDDDDNPNRTVNDVDRTRYTTLAVTIKVVDQEDPGKVTINEQDPQEGKSVLATLSDEDGGVTGVSWQWSRIAALAADNFNDPDDADSDPDPVKRCADVEEITGAAGREWAVITDATSPIYTPDSYTFDHDGDGGEETDVSPEVGYCLRATATYTDDLVTPDDTDTAEVDESMDMAEKSPTRAVQRDDPANTAPEFDPDQDPNTPGKQAVAERSVAENFEGKVGEPVVAEDSDLLVYSVDDTDNFKVDNGGQISTAVELDYEALPDDAKYYMVELRAEDPSGASDSIMVKITVTDENDDAIITGVETISYEENGEDPVATFSASDPDADAGDIDWDLKGVDAGAFEIDGGVLTFESPPDFESPTDKDEDTAISGDQGAGDNKYQITVLASGGEQDVVVKVTNKNEPGSVTFTQIQAQATRPLMAEYDDDDKPKDPTWQWSLGPSAEGPWTEISGATSADRAPSEDDIGSWLQATVSYTDSFGATSASGAIGPVVDETLANAAPSFSGLDDDDDMAGVQIEIDFNENAEGNIGDPLTATDADGDPRLYTITGGLDADCFGIAETSGQLSLSGKRNFESPNAACKTGGDARTSAADADRTDDGTNDYVVEITATDPTGATGSATVTVSLQDVNEASEFTGPAKADENVTLYIDENEKTTDADTDGQQLELRQNEADADETADTDDSNTAVVAYTATDPDADTLDTNDQIRYKVEGADAAQFDIGEETGVLGFASADDKLGAKGADYEGKKSYSITIVATSGGIANDDDDNPNRTVNDVDRTRYTTLAVTIKVVDQEDPGKVTIDVQEPQEGRSVLATLSDEDGGVTGVSWQWSRIAALAADNFNDPDDADSDPDPVKRCADVEEITGAAGREWAVITDATSPIYTPDSYTFDHDGDGGEETDVSPEVGYCLRATATYTDDLVTPDDTDTAEVDESMDMAEKSPTRAVQRDDPANTAPEFDPDQDPNTPGKQAVAERSVAENFEGKVGEPVVAEDSDLLVYSVDDTDNFKVDNGGQISTAVELDYEALPEDAKYYMVMLTATDPSGAIDTVMVKITVTDGPDTAIIVLQAPPAFDADTAERMVDENSATGTAVGDPVTATDPNEDDLTYSLDEMGDMYFDIDAATGQIAVGEGTMLDFESETTSYSVTVTADDGTGRSATIDVTINVTNVNDAPTFDAETAELEIAENSAAGAAVGDPVAATDQDEDELTYNLDEMGDMYFDIDAMGQITVGEGTMLDYEETTSYSVTVTADDGEATAEVAVTINVTDVNDAPAFDAETAELEIAENSAAGAAVGDPVAATDQDEDELTYSLDEMGDMYFDIDAMGQITVGEGTMLDFESETTSYSVTVTADDGEATAEVAVTINVTDVNDAPAFDAETAELEIAENSAAGAAVGDPVAATDQDEDELTYSLDEMGDMYFDIDAMGQITVGEGTMLDFESETTSYSVTVTADDGEATAEVAVAINVTDVNDAPAFDAETAELEIAENSAAGAAVGDPVAATDQDEDELTYSLDEMGDMYFDIDAMGQITVGEGTMLDFESETTSYSVTVTADDGEATAEVAVTINVTDVNDAPAFDAETAELEIAENSAAGAAVGDPVAATDQDEDELTYSLDEMGDMYFDIDAMGQITVGEGTMLDFESETTSYSVTVTADDGEATAEVAVAINVTDVNDAPAFDAETAELEIAENSAAGAAVGDPVAATDQDEDELTYSLDEMGDMYFDIDAMGQITVGEGTMLDFESETTSYSVTVTADDGEATAEVAVTINVTDVEESPCVLGGAVSADDGDGLDMDCQTLLDIRDDLVGGGTALNWSADLAIGEWEGVAGTGSGRVTHIHRVDKGLAGVLPAGITALDALEKLTLTDNDLTGEIPDLNGLDSIEVLVLGGNAFTGGIPATLGDLDSLLRLWLHRNDGGFEGGIPSELGGLPNLRYLMLHGNGLTGGIPTELGSLSNLKALYLYNNMLTGSIPAELGNLVDAKGESARLVYLQNNMLSGDVPAELGNLVSLTALRLSGNMLSGCIPAAIIDAAVDADAADLAACADDGNGDGGNGNGDGS